MTEEGTRVVDRRSGRPGTVVKTLRRQGIALAEVRFDDDRGRTVCRLASDLQLAEERRSLFADMEETGL